MTEKELIKCFQEHHPREYVRFDLVEKPLHPRPDVCAFLMMSEMFPGETDIIDCAEHDRFWFSIQPIQLAPAATEEKVKDLIRCGVLYDNDLNAFYMSV